MSSKSGAQRPILGESKPVLDMIKMIQKVAPAQTSVLIVGESGTGKELVARMIHEQSSLSKGPFIAVNCGAIPENLIESEMFGHKRGSFTGAVSDKMGLFEAANEGTLFLDEVGELPLSMQVKLLRALQERVTRKVGGNEDIKVNARILAATNRDLEIGVKKGTFREDLYYRLNVIMIRTPPLRERGSDIRMLAESFVKKFSAKQKKKIIDFEEATLKILESYSWPGNVRELENSIERMVTLETGEMLGTAGLPTAIQDYFSKNGHPVVQVPSLPGPDFAQGPIDLEKVMVEVEKIYIRAAMKQTGSDQTRAAALLGLTPKKLSLRLTKLGL